MSDAPRPQHRKNAFNNSKMTLSAPLPGQKGIYAKLSFDIFRNNPRVIVATNDPALKNPENQYGRITAALDPVVFFSFLEFIEKCVRSTGPTKYKIENFNHGYANGQRSQEIEHLSNLIIGRDEEGHIYLSVTSTKANWPVIKFNFGFADRRYHHVVKGDGSPLSTVETSQLVAMAYYRLLQQLAASVMDTHYEEPPAPQGGFNKGGKPGGGYGNRQGGGGGGYGGQRPGGGGGYQQRAPSEAPAAPSTDDAGDGFPF